MFFVRPCWSMVSNIYDLCMFASGLYIYLLHSTVLLGMPDWRLWWFSDHLLRAATTTLCLLRECVDSGFFAQSNSSRLLFFFRCNGFDAIGFWQSGMFIAVGCWQSGMFIAVGCWQSGMFIAVGFWQSGMFIAVGFWQSGMLIAVSA